jgi:hypothetical protein
MQTPNYYAVIPAEVRYDETLPANAKLLYGEISALCNKEGYCWATNAYFAKLYKSSNVTISRWFSALENAGYIETKIEYDKQSKKVTKRLTKMISLNKNDKGGINKNDKDNTSINNTNNTRNIIESFDPLIIQACKNIVQLFVEDFRPKTIEGKLNWLKAIDNLDKKLNINPRQAYYIIKKTMEDDFWSTNLRSPMKLLRNDKNGVKWVYVFKNKYAKDMEV